MKIYLGSDHGGYEAKEEVKKWLEGLKKEVVDMGAHELDSDDDFVEYGEAVASKLEENDGDMGVLFCRNGVGMSVVANRFSGVRGALGFDIEQVRKARTDDDVNCLVIPADYVKLDMIKDMVKVFLETEYHGEERYERRIAKMSQTGGGGCGSCVCGQHNH